MNPTWLTPQVQSLAKEMKDKGEFTKMRDLASALEAAGCRNQDILAHWRNSKGHVTGCWLIELLNASSQIDIGDGK